MILYKASIEADAKSNQITYEPHHDKNLSFSVSSFRIPLKGLKLAFSAMETSVAKVLYTYIF